MGGAGEGDGGEGGELQNEEPQFLIEIKMRPYHPAGHRGPPSSPCCSRNASQFSTHVTTLPSKAI